MFAAFSLQKKNEAISGSSGAFSDSSGGFVAVTNLTASLKVSGQRSVLLMLLPDGSGNSSSLGCDASAATATILVNFKRGSTVVARLQQLITISGAASVYHLIPPGAFEAEEISPPEGTHTYSVEISSGLAGRTAYASYVKLFVKELLY